MTKNVTIKEHLNRIRPKAHKTQMKNGQYVRMAKASVKARKAKKKELSTGKR